MGFQVSFSDLVEKPDLNFAFVKDLDLSRFSKVNQFEEKREFDRSYLIAAIAIGVLSLFTGWYVIGGLVTALFLYKSIRIIKVETKAYMEHIKEVDSLFKPSMRAFMSGYRLKSKAIRNAMKGINVTSCEEAEKAIKLLSKIYDRDAKPSEWKYRTRLTENTTEDKIYRLVKMTAEKLVVFNLEGVRDDLIMKKMVALKNSANFFLHGVEGCVDSRIGEADTIDVFSTKIKKPRTKYVEYYFRGTTLVVLDDPAMLDYVLY
jgi:hypothetical protein